MRCAICSADKAPGMFSESQKQEPAEARKCSACEIAAITQEVLSSPLAPPPAHTPRRAAPLAHILSA